MTGPSGLSGPTNVAGVLALLAPLADAAGELTVTGTLSGWRHSRAAAWGELIDHDPGGQPSARLPIVVPWATAQRADQALARRSVRLGDGTTVTVTGRLQVHPRYGPVRLAVSSISAVDAAVGIHESRRQLLLEALMADGSGQAQAALTMPVPLRRVAVVVPNVGGAARADLRGQLDLVHLDVVEHPVAMQGPGAPANLARAIRRAAAAGADAVVIVRGGGAPADLAVFDSEPVARAICASPVPVVLGVGHTPDRTVADHVAHHSASTPTAAGAYIIDAARHPARAEALAAATAAGPPPGPPPVPPAHAPALPDGPRLSYGRRLAVGLALFGLVLVLVVLVSALVRLG